VASAPVVLVPGFWLGAWAWDEVAEALRSNGHDVTALTLPGLESADADRSSVTLTDHVDVICDAERNIVGFEVRCEDRQHRFLPRSAAREGASGIEIDSTLALLDTEQLEFYRRRGVSLRPGEEPAA